MNGGFGFEHKSVWINEPILIAPIGMRLTFLWKNKIFSSTDRSRSFGNKLGMSSVNLPGSIMYCMAKSLDFTSLIVVLNVTDYATRFGDHQCSVL